MNDTPIIVNVNTPEFVKWLAACEALYEAHMKANFDRLPRDKFVPICGGRYIRINQTAQEVDPVTKRPNRDSAWAFIDRTTGDVLKPATYRAPAKHARGNIFDASNGMASMGPYGPAYLRR